MADNPKGVVAVLLNGRGAVMASVADFEQNSYGGFPLREAQRLRVRDKLADKFIADYCVPDMASVLLGSKAQSIVNDLQRRCDWKVHLEDVNWDDD